LSSDRGGRPFSNQQARKGSQERKLLRILPVYFLDEHYVGLRTKEFRLFSHHSAVAEWAPRREGQRADRERLVTTTQGNTTLDFD
jgi:hypothetical protein